LVKTFGALARLAQNEELGCTPVIREAEEDWSRITTQCLK